MSSNIRSIPSSFVHLDVRSFFSLKEGAFSPEQLASRAAALGMPSAVLTDRDGLYGAARFVAACAREGVRPILGASVTLQEPGHSDPGSLVLLAADEIGYANLCRLLTDAHMTEERGAPELVPAQVCAHAGGLVALAGPRSAAGRLAANGRLAAARRELGPLREAFGRDRLFIAAEHRLERDSDTEIRALLRLADIAEVRAVAANPVRYLVEDDAFLADVLECMREIVPLAAHNVSRRNAEGWLKPAVAMRGLFAERPDLCDATLEVADACRFDLGLRRLHFPEFPTPQGRSADAMLAERCWRSMQERGVRKRPEAVDRLHHELSSIRQMGYAGYFLTVADIVEDIRAMGIHCACRGSAAGSFVCYLLRISDVDALGHDLVFERFLNPLREELPDIDIDVESARREDVYDMVLARHGEDRTACVAMIDTYRARSALREVGKTLGLPEVEVGTIAKAFPHISARNLSRAIEELPELVGENVRVPQLELLFRVAERLDGFPRHIALHPCGIVLSDAELTRRVPLERSFRGYRTVQADKDDVEMLGYLKLDVLGVRMLSSMRHALAEIARTEGVKIDLDEIPYDDESTFELIRASDTIGCFQIESPGQRELLQKLQPTRFEDLIVDISLFRPGPVKSDMIRPFLRRRLGDELPRYAHPSLEPALRETWGVIVYHEQVMRTIAALAGYELAEADRIRRQLGDDEQLPILREEFLTRTDTRGVDRAVAEQVWDDVSQFASFGFCKAHAAAFAVPTYRSSWLKAHYPAHLFAGLLTHDPGMYPKRLILEDARQHAIEILPLDVNISDKDYVVESLTPDTVERPAAYGIRLALQDVHGINDSEIVSILRARAEGPFRSVPEFLRRTTVARPVVEAIAHAGGFDAIDGVRGTRRNRLFEAITTPPEREGDQLDLFSAGHAELAGDAPLRDYSDAEVVRAELEVLGVDATRHLVSFYEPLLADLQAVRAGDLWRHRSGERVLIAGVKVASQTPAVRSGQRIIFLTLDDATGPIDVTVFESVQTRVARTVFHGFLLAVWGELRRTGVKGVSIIAEEVWDLTELAAARREGRLEQALHEPSRSRENAAPRRLWHASGGSAG
ncbi:MAG: DNA polymerase III subunit alpha [Actinomycetota bacterium]